MDENLKHVTFNVLDLCKRNHFIKVYVPDDYPTTKSMLLFETMLPSVIVNSLSKVNNLFSFYMYLCGNPFLYRLNFKYIY